MDSTMADFWIKLISTLGFPIFVAVWLLMRTDALLREIRDLLKTMSSPTPTPVKDGEPRQA